MPAKAGARRGLADARRRAARGAGARGWRRTCEESRRLDGRHAEGPLASVRRPSRRVERDSERAVERRRTLARAGAGRAVGRNGACTQLRRQHYPPPEQRCEADQRLEDGTTLFGCPSLDASRHEVGCLVLSRRKGRARLRKLPLHLAADDGRRWRHASLSLSPHLRLCRPVRALFSLPALGWESVRLLLLLRPRRLARLRFCSESSRRGRVRSVWCGGKGGYSHAGGLCPVG